MKRKDKLTYCGYYSQCPNKMCLRDMRNSERGVLLSVEFDNYRPDKNGKCKWYLE